MNWGVDGNDEYVTWTGVLRKIISIVTDNMKRRTEMEKIIVTNEQVKILHNERFLKMYDLQYREGKHYFEATRRETEDLVVLKDEAEFKSMIPDAVTVAVVVYLKSEAPKLLLTYEYRYPLAQYVLSPVAGLVDPEDKEAEEPLVQTAIREIKEESGLDFDEATDRAYVINPCAFSSPGMTDESNGFACAEIHIDNLDVLTHNGAVGTEMFDGFILMDIEEAKETYSLGRDSRGFCYSLATWAVLGYFINKWS